MCRKSLAAYAGQAQSQAQILPKVSKWVDLTQPAPSLQSCATEQRCMPNIKSKSRPQPTDGTARIAHGGVTACADPQSGAVGPGPAGLGDAGSRAREPRSTGAVRKAGLRTLNFVDSGKHAPAERLQKVRPADAATTTLPT